MIAKNEKYISSHLFAAPKAEPSGKTEKKPLKITSYRLKAVENKEKQKTLKGIRNNKINGIDCKD